jgi:hypothetical protein
VKHKTSSKSKQTSIDIFLVLYIYACAHGCTSPRLLNTAMQNGRPSEGRTHREIDRERDREPRETYRWKSTWRERQDTQREKERGREGGIDT